MGLDMYLNGLRYIRTSARSDDRKKGELFDLGYWRKHPNLHGYIVQTFADGKDECQEIALSADDIRRIIAAIEADELPKTTGFFFGESDGSEKEGDLSIFREALAWLGTEEEDAWRSVYYQASW